MHITIMRGVYTPIDPSDQIEADWHDITDLLTAYNDAQQLYSSAHKNAFKEPKEAVPMFNLWQFKTIAEGAESGRKKITENSYKSIPGTVRRCRANAVALHGIVLDLDGKMRLSDALNKFSKTECVIYTTYNNGIKAGGDRFRVVMPFTRPMPVAEFERKLDALKAAYPDADNASWSMSQAIYMHSAGRPDLAFATHITGAWINPDDFKETPKQPDPPQTPARVYDQEFSGEPYKAALLQALSTCSGVRRGASSGNSGLLGLATLVQHAGGDYNDFETICDAVLAFDSCARSDRSVRKAAWGSSQQSQAHATARFRDEWIAANGGQPFVNFYKPEQTTRKNKLAALLEKYQIPKQLC